MALAWLLGWRTVGIERGAVCSLPPGGEAAAAATKHVCAWPLPAKLVSLLSHHPGGDKLTPLASLTRREAQRGSLVAQGHTGIWKETLLRGQTCSAA